VVEPELKAIFSISKCYSRCCRHDGEEGHMKD